MKQIINTGMFVQKNNRTPPLPPTTPPPPQKKKRAENVYKIVSQLLSSLVAVLKTYFILYVMEFISSFLLITLTREIWGRSSLPRSGQGPGSAPWVQLCSRGELREGRSHRSSPLRNRCCSSCPAFHTGKHSNSLSGHDAPSLSLVPQTG